MPDPDRCGGAAGDEQWVHHFDHQSPELAADLHGVLAGLRTGCPVAHSDQHGGFWVVTRYEDVLAVAQDWGTFSSAHGVSPGPTAMTVKAIPEHIDPPLQRHYKRLITPWFTPAVVARQEEATRRIVTGLIDGFIDGSSPAGKARAESSPADTAELGSSMADEAKAGTCELMSAFARPLPGLTFFGLVLGAPPDEVARVNALATTATDPTNPDSKAAWPQLITWIRSFIEARRDAPRRHDVVDAVLHAEIEGRPITEDEVIGIIQLLVLGGLDTTAGALGSMAVRFATEPGTFAWLADHPDRIDDAVEELLRLDGPFIAIGRTATVPARIGDQAIAEGDKVLIYWASADRDEREFDHPDRFDPDRATNRHLAFGAGPHRCAGSHLARMNLRIALEELTRRLDSIEVDLDDDRADPIRYHSVLNRGPRAVPLRFTIRPITRPTP